MTNKRCCLLVKFLLALLNLFNQVCNNKKESSGIYCHLLVEATIC